ncbi:hypothetical protein M4L39_10205 [Staphylococcus equorum]|uniref:DUF3278 domain-containing protein n=1 Tax=Staphylococcus equorum TaxID=246432 RepID=A0A9X4LG42_9STAP|nr:hypothetical protein [Staphylococcus equorum]MDG0843819.1 hypothetical protein [Staphylococcus equorum]MDG0860110.1 hypothetical protein [Staphylococcus equorum]
MENNKLLRLIPNFRFTDEHERQHLLHEYAKYFVWLFWGIMIISLADIWIELYLHRIPILGILGFALIMILSLIMSITIRSKKIDVVESCSEEAWKKEMKKVRNGSYIFAVTIFLVANFNQYILPFIIHNGVPEKSDILINLLISIGCALIGGAFVYTYSRRKVTRAYIDK